MAPMCMLWPGASNGTPATDKKQLRVTTSDTLFIINSSRWCVAISSARRAQAHPDRRRRIDYRNDMMIRLSVSHVRLRPAILTRAGAELAPKPHHHRAALAPKPPKPPPRATTSSMLRAAPKPLQVQVATTCTLYGHARLIGARPSRHIARRTAHATAHTPHRTCHAPR